MGDTMNTKTARQKELKKYYQRVTKKEEDRYESLMNDEKKKRKLTYIDRLFIRIFLSSLLLLSLIGIDKWQIFKINNQSVEATFSQNFNFLKFAKLFNGIFGGFIPLDNDITVYESTQYDMVIFDEVTKENCVKNYTFDGVTALTSGVVTRINKNKNGTYDITIKGSDDVNYCYKNLEGIDIRIYSYVEANTIIGKAHHDEGRGCYTFNLTIYEKGVYYDYYEKASD